MSTRKSTAASFDLLSATAASVRANSIRATTGDGIGKGERGGVRVRTIEEILADMLALDASTEVDGIHIPDYELEHSKADELLCEALLVLAKGADRKRVQQLVDHFQNMVKWYA